MARCIDRNTTKQPSLYYFELTVYFSVEKKNKEKKKKKKKTFCSVLYYKFGISWLSSIIKLLFLITLFNNVLISLTVSFTSVN